MSRTSRFNEGGPLRRCLGRRTSLFPHNASLVGALGKRATATLTAEAVLWGTGIWLGDKVHELPPLFGRAFLSGHHLFQRGIKTAQRIVTAACVNGAVPVRGESDKSPNSQN